MAFNKNVCLSCLCLLIALGTVAQKNYDLSGSDDGGSPPFDQSTCVSSEVRSTLLSNIQENLQNLPSKGGLSWGDESEDLSEASSTDPVLFEFPLQQSNFYQGCGFYAVSAYVDHVNGSQAGDYHCGFNSYNNHSGTDYTLWPFDWLMMDQEVGQVIAAADGLLIAKDDGHFDEQCANGLSYHWNYVAILHADSSITVYGHLKSGSVTPKPIGSAISVGEHLGTIGSSGNSSGPHLHFEVIDQAGNIIDPYLGDCNSSTSTSRWVDQPSYHAPSINKVSTHANLPDFNWNDCPERPVPNYQDEFCLGETIYFMNFLSHIDPFVSVFNNIYRPDGSLYDSWARSYAFGLNDPTHQETYYWWKSYEIPVDEMTGTWTYEVIFADKTCSHRFDITSPDLRLYQSLYPTMSKISDTVTYNITIVNESNCDVHDIEATAYPNGILGGHNYTASQGSYNNLSAKWNVGTIPANDSATISILYQSYQEGVFFNKTEITNMLPDSDVDSTPNNSVELEDDMAKSCISIPVSVCTDQPFEVELAAPGFYGAYQWFRNGVPILSATDSIFTATELGEYNLLVNGGILGFCDQELCCPVVIEGGDCCSVPKCIQMTVRKRE